MAAARPGLYANLVHGPIAHRITDHERVRHLVYANRVLRAELATLQKRIAGLQLNAKGWRDLETLYKNKCEQLAAAYRQIEQLKRALSAANDAKCIGPVSHPAKSPDATIRSRGRGDAHDRQRRRVLPR